MKKILSSTLILSCLLLLTQCKNEDDTLETIDTTSEGIFLDSPVEGLSYKYLNVVGLTNSEGKFEYKNNQTVIFSIGGIIIGETIGKEIITPLDLVENGTVNNQEVRNIASFLQSLDEDNNPTNGILINEQTREALNNESLDFNSDSFLVYLTELVDRINTVNSSSLVVVYSNDAAYHLAESLDLEDQFTFLPQVIQGREWEIGTYYNYSSNGINEYFIKIENENLTNVRYHFGNGRGYLLDMHYEQNRLNGIGNYYNSGLNLENPTDTIYLYDNRTASTGFVFDYGSNTFIGYYNLYKTQGVVGSLQGVYKNLLFNTKQIINSDEIIIHYIADKEITISDPNENGDFPVNVIEYDIDHNIIQNYTLLITANDINNQNILLVQFQGTDHIFLNNDIEYYFYNGTYGIKE